MTPKRLILLALTLFAVIKVFLSLGGSLSEPQIQTRLELYQTNLMLQSLDYKSENNQENWSLFSQSLMGENPYESAQQQYENSAKVLNKNLAVIDKQIEILQLQASNEAIIKDLEKSRQEIKDLQQELTLKIGLIYATENKIALAQKTWNQIIINNPENSIVLESAKLLNNLWSNPPIIQPNTEQKITRYLEDWFQQTALKRLYEVQNKTKQLTLLTEVQQQQALKAVNKLILLIIIPVAGGLIGVGLLIFVIIQLILKRENSLLFIDKSFRWETPWTGEMTWEVIIIGFFTFSQLILPLFFSFLFQIFKINPAQLNLRGQAIDILVSYLLMAIVGLGILFLYVKEFNPLPKDWFKFELKGKAFLWGIGGYLIALPLVVLISLINQQFWQGQGGSNPLLFLALKAQDQVVLTIFFITASILAPIFEEIMFRGFLLPSLTRHFSAWNSILISSLIFATAHLSLSEILPLTMLGIVLGFVYTRSRNLLSSILLHSLWNGGTLFSLFILGSH